MKLFSPSRSASERWLGSEACFCCSRQNSISVLVAKPRSTTTLPTSVSRLEEMPRALLSDCGMPDTALPPAFDSTLGPLELAKNLPLAPSSVYTTVDFTTDSVKGLLRICVELRATDAAPGCHQRQPRHSFTS